METFSALLAICAGNSPVPGEFPTQRPVTRSFDIYFDLRPNERLSKQSLGWRFETLSPPLWRHRKVVLTNDLCGDLAYWFLPDASFGLQGNVSDNGLWPGSHPAVIWTNVGILLLEPLKQTSMKFEMDIIHFHTTKCIWKCRMRNCVHFVTVSM